MVEVIVKVEDEMVDMCNILGINYAGECQQAADARLAPIADAYKRRMSENKVAEAVAFKEAYDAMSDKDKAVVDEKISAVSVQVGKATQLKEG